MNTSLLFYAVSTILERLLSFFILPVLTNELTEEYFGVWSQLVVFSGVLVPIVLLSLPTALIRYYPSWKDERQRHFNLALVVLLPFLFYLTISVLSVVYKGYVAAMFFGNEIYSHIVIFLSLFLLNEAAFELAVAYLRATNKIKTISYYVIVKAMFRIAGVVVGFVLLDLDFIKSLYIYTAINLVFVVFLIAKEVKFSFFIKGSVTPNSYGDLVTCIKYSTPLLITAVLTPINNFSDRYFLVQHVELDQLGAYAAAYTLSAIVGLAYSIIGFVLFPTLVARYTSGDIKRCEDLFGKSVILYFSLLLPFYVLMSLVGPELLVFITDDNYLVNRGLFSFMVLSIGLFGVHQLFLYINLLKHSTSSVLLIILISSVVNVTSNTILVPIYGIYGAAASAVLSNILLAVMTYYVSRHVLQWRLPAYEVTIIGLFSLLVYWFLNELNNQYFDSLRFGFIYTVCLLVLLYLVFNLFSKRCSVFKIIGDI